MAKYFPRVDAYPQIKAVLEALPDNPMVTEQWPRTECSGSFIVVSQLTNANTSNSVVDQLSYQIDVWSEDEEQHRTLCDHVDEALCTMGFKRTMEQPADHSAGFRKIFRYGRKVDKRSMRLID